MNTSEILPKLPFRAEHVGSLLRPAYLLEARAGHAAGRLSAADLREVEDRAIAEAVALQRSVGLRSITDGEYRRTYFHLDFLRKLDGVECSEPETRIGLDGKSTLVPPAIRVTGRVRHGRAIQVADFAYLQSLAAAGCVSKVTIPSPTMLHFRGGRAGISAEHYPELEPAFYEDVAQAYADELAALAQAGCRYVQLDDTNLAYLCDEHMRAQTRQRGDDPFELPFRYAEFINRVVALKPQGMTIGIHLCRGNFRSTHAASGGYEPVAEALLKAMNVDVYFLEYDDERSGGFAPLRYLPGGKTVVLGLLSSKFAALESVDDIRRRIEDAARYVPLEQLALSPQCGFSSTVHGNDISFDVQKAKLARVVEIADAVWGSV
jgi:5-methyltetrahydropteroyltriglutamate--homocysteine methyltransferase